MAELKLKVHPTNAHVPKLELFTVTVPPPPKLKVTLLNVELLSCTEHEAEVLIVQLLMVDPLNVIAPLPVLLIVTPFNVHVLKVRPLVVALNTTLLYVILVELREAVGENAVAPSPLNVTGNVPLKYEILDGKLVKIPLTVIVLLYSLFRVIQEFKATKF